ncbi:MAG: paraquat-inducible protein A [Bacteroidota bacterium]|nr:paraquat-inducible protein A [Bacteroidota bacterium]MDP4244953.1 paraquat-inducible protein A [Bacteroidota bacterium]MDP4252509.1 paraquat-inducible protein A [Bacteroidota bacterium]MDP4260228.1 paraquat-inducible protein A [Bacteroidota bacterium]
MKVQRGALMAGVSLLLVVVGFCGWRVHELSAEQKIIKQDYSIANNISFGILSVNKWRDLLVTSVSHRIEHFTLTKAEQDSLEQEVESILNALIDKADSMINAPQKTMKGKLGKLAFNALIDKKNLRREVPSYAHRIIGEVMKPRNKQKLKNLAIDKLEDLGQATYDSSGTGNEKTVDSIYQKYGVTDATAFSTKTNDALSVIRRETVIHTFGMLGGVLILALLWYLLRNRRPLYVPLYIMSILMALILLLVGLTSTMIEIDARINSLDFHLIGESISFKDQVLFFQSKSILNVVGLLIHTGKYDSILVGVLILCFSIFFPITKLLSTGVYLLGEKQWSKNKWIAYFAFHSGKWSMADVMVVAIFMAYIGFNGILNDQMSDLDVHSDSLTSIATNHTSLQPGYLVFVGFVLWGLVLSQILKMITKRTSLRKSGKNPTL